MRVQKIVSFTLLFMILLITSVAMISDKDSAINTVMVSTFLGGEENVEPWKSAGMALDENDNIYIVTKTSSADFPVTSSSFDTQLNGQSDLIIAKLGSDLKTLLASTYLGGTGEEFDGIIDVDKDGYVYVAGTTTSRDFPVTPGVFEENYKDSHYNIFLAKLSRDLDKLLTSTFLTASTSSYGQISVIRVCDDKGTIIIGGMTDNQNFPTTDNAFQLKYGGGKSDHFVTILDKNMTKIISSTFLGGKDREILRNLEIDSKGYIYIGGSTSSTNYPTTSNAFKREVSKDGVYGCVAKFNPELSSLMASTYIGESGNDFIYGIILDKDDNVYFTGHMHDSMPTTPGAYKRKNKGHPDTANLGKLNNDLSKLLAHTFLVGGGEGSWVGGFSFSSGLVLDKKGNIFVSGITNVPYYPTTSGAFDDTHNGDRDIFLSKLDKNLSMLMASTLIGGRGRDLDKALRINNRGELIILGVTTAPDFPITEGTYDDSFNKSQDVFVMKISTDLKEKMPGEIHAAAKQGDLPKLKSMLSQKPCLIHAKDRYQRIPLHWAVKFGYENIVSSLLNKNVNVNEQDESGNTPLHLAALFSKYKVAEILVSQRANLNLGNQSGDTPIHLAALSGNYDIAELLVSKGADIDLKNKDGNSALHRAVNWRQKDVAELLIKQGANLHLKNNEGNTPLHLAANVYRSKGIIDLLLAHGADLDVRNNENKTPLHIAANYYWEPNALQLISVSEDLNIQDNDGKTPLHYAASLGAANIVKALIAKNVDVKAKDKSGKTALDLANESNQKEIVEILQKFKKDK